MAVYTTYGSDLGGSSSSSVAGQIFDFLLSKGLTPTAAAGILGNLAVESGLDPAKVQGGSESSTIVPGEGYGLAQWTSTSRQAGLASYAASLHQPVDSLSVQLNYLWQEISSGSEGVTPALLNSAPTPQAAAQLFAQDYERPAGTSSYATRESYAVDYFDEFMSGGSGNGAPQGGASSGSISGGSTSLTLGGSPVTFFQSIDSALQMPGFTITNPIGSLLQDGQALAIRAFLFLLGIMLVLFGLIITVKEIPS